MHLIAYGFYGGGACPTQFYWHNKDKTKWYYFRYRNGHWWLKEGPDEIDNCDYEEYKIIAEGYKGTCYDGYCSQETMQQWLKEENISLEIMEVSDYSG